jgi:hypothetical protein
LHRVERAWPPEETRLTRVAELDEPRREVDMLWTIFVILIVMWLLGMVSSYTLGGFIHLLLLLAIAVVLINIIQGRRPI